MSKDAQHIIDESQKYLIKTYVAQPVVMERGEGCYAYDSDGKKYVDFACGIAVASLGHAHPAILKTIREQSEKMITCQASYATKPKLDAAKLLIGNSCFDQVYFCNSGTEAVEAALKTARKWAYEHKSQNAHEIIAFRKSFHGRTYGAGSVTEKRHVQPYFGPYLPGIHFADFNNIESVKKFVSNKTCAIIIEPVQGEGGLLPATPEFMKALRQLCDEQKIVLIFDEVQAGMGRIGSLYAYEKFGVEPDIACLAKGLGGGFPVGAMVAKLPYADAIVVGTHGTTYGGNPLACAVAHTVVSEMLKPGFLENVNKTGKYFVDGLKEVQRDSNKIIDIRGMGMMVGVDTSIEIKTLLKTLQKNGLLATQAGESTLRLTPPLIATEKVVKEALDIIAKTLKEAE
jgi:acetylornithine/N-succinyldiaminopimelate aminotransferase